MLARIAPEDLKLTPFSQVLCRGLTTEGLWISCSRLAPLVTRNH